QESCEGAVVVQRGTGTFKRELVMMKGTAQSGDELTAEDPTEDPHRQEEMRPCSDPASVVECQTTARHHTVNMRMSIKLLSPGVEDGEEADLGAEMLGIASHLEQGGSTGFKQQRKQSPLVLPDHRHERVRYAEDEVVIAHRQQFLLAAFEPLLARVGLALGAVAVPARVVGDSLMTAARAQIAMPTESGSTAARDGLEYLDLRPGQRLDVMFAKPVACDSDDIGHLERWPAHPLRSSSDARIVSWSSGFTAARRCVCERCKYTVVSSRRSWPISS